MVRDFISKAVLVAVCGVGASVSQAMPVVDEIDFDVNTLSFTTTGQGLALFGSSWTGTINIASTAQTTLSGVSTITNPGGIVAQILPTLNGGFKSFAGSIDVSGGSVTGGSFKLTYDNGDSTDTVYSADLIPFSISGVGKLVKQSAINNRFRVSIDTNNGAFSQNNLGGYDLTPWVTNQGIGGNLFGRIITFDINVVTRTADSDIAVLVPLPSPAIMGVVSLAGLGLVRAFSRKRFQTVSAN